ncbi:hypothetical protein LPJ75_003993 [Coemansia sp. RSA 2598]|nr:hypothetical protein LPJ75_003993 [Coemansia sp. RSA 2598]
MEFSQRPATQGLAAAPPAHYHQYAPSAEDAYPGAPRRLPSLSELLVPQEPPVQQAAVAGRRSRDPASYSTHHPYSHAHQQMQMQIQAQRAAQAIDLPVSSAHHHQHHRDSVSASSSVSSQDTLIDSYAAAAAKHAQPGQLAPGMCEEDVFAAASILMSLRTCKLPC